MKFYSEAKALRLLSREEGYIGQLEKRYAVPGAVIRGILLKEMTQINLGDYLADLAVLLGLFSKKDSSTGYGQIFGKVALRAAKEAVSEGTATFEELGLPSSLSEENPADVRLVWKKLHFDKRANLLFTTLNLRSCAREMTGRVDFPSYGERELKLVLTRYNAPVDHVTAYGEEAYRLVKRFQAEE